MFTRLGIRESAFSFRHMVAITKASHSLLYVPGLGLININIDDKAKEESKATDQSTNPQRAAPIKRPNSE